MRIFAPDPVEFSFDAENRITLTAVFLLNLESGDSGTITALARQWAGAAGDAFRVPDASGRSYTADSTVAVTGIEIRNGDDSACCRVIYTGRELRAASSASSPESGISETRDADGIRIRTGHFRFGSALSASLIPEVGSVLSWAGANFFCESAALQVLDSGEYELILKAREFSSRQAGSIEREVNSDGEECAKAVYLVGSTALSAFLAANPVGNAASWAGSRFYLSDVRVLSEGVSGSRVELRARKITTRMLQVTRREDFAGFTRSESPTREITYTALWRVHNEDLAGFELLTGTPAEWVEEETLITKIEPKRLSPLEWELIIEAKAAGSPSLCLESDNDDDRSNLAARHDVNATLGEFMMDAADCGYIRTEDGSYEVIPEFSAAAQCPLTRSSGSIDETFIDVVLKTVRISEVCYYRNGLSSNLGKLVDFGTTRVFSGTVAGHTGSYRREDIDASEVRDNLHRLWTRIRRCYELAPAGFSWNAAYFS